MGPAAIMAIKGGTAALSGGVNSAIQGANNRAALKEYINQQKAIQGQLAEGKRTESSQVTTAYAPQLQGMGDDVANYYSTLRSADYGQYDVSAPEKYQGRDLNELTQQMMNPQTDTMVQTASNKVQGSAANTGGLFSGITAKNIANATAQVQAEQYDKARQAAQAQQEQDYRQYSDEFANLLKANEVNRGNYASNIANLGALNTAQTGALNTQQEQLGNINALYGQRQFDTSNALATAAGQKAGVGSMWSNFAQGALGGLSKAF